MKIKYKILFAIIVFCIAFYTFSSNIILAQSVKLNSFNSYSDVMDDLSKDEGFTIDDYPSIELDYSLNVIQVAESSAKELFIYVYQPSGTFHNLLATSINFSTGIYENLHPVNYSLTLLNSYGVFYKYRVDKFEVLSDVVRYYEIVNIMRKFDSKIDPAPGGGNTVSEVSYPVAKRFTACTYNDVVSYTNTETEVITITDKFVSCLRYTDGWFITHWLYTDRHVVAFSTDWNIDRLYEVELSFISKDYTATGVEMLPFHLWDVSVSKTYKNEQSHNVVLNSSQHTGSNADGLFGYKHSWDRIESGSSFIENNKDDLSDDTKNNIINKQWVLSFFESQWGNYDAPVTVNWGTEVSDVMILRLKFETNGIVYNLGVVDTKQTGSGLLGNLQSTKLQDMIRTVFTLIVLILLVVTLSPFLPAIINVLVAIVKSVFKSIVLVVSLPFRLFKKLFNKGSSKR